MDPIQQHKKIRGKIAITATTKVDQKSLAWLYTPGVAQASLAIAKKPSLVYDLTRKWNTVAVVTDGTRVLGLGNIGARASLPVMEGKALLYHHFANIDAIPIALKTQDPQEIVRTVDNISPFFGAINLEDIECPKCFEVGEMLEKKLTIPVLHDDQYGTGVVALAGLTNALKLVQKKLEQVRIVIAGAGAAGTGITKLLLAAGAKHIIVLDSKGIIYKGRTHLAPYKKYFTQNTNLNSLKGGLTDALIDADVFIGVSGQANLLNGRLVQKMAPKGIVFALTNPEPEIKPLEALSAGAYIAATGRSDFQNQVNNSLAFPGIMRGILDARISKFNITQLVHVAQALAKLVDPKKNKIIPLMSDKRIVPALARAIRA